MTLLGAGELAGLKARGLAKQERDPSLRNERIRAERQRAHMRALLAIPPAKFRPGEIGRIWCFLVAIVRVAPAQHQVAAAELPGSLEPVAQGVADHLRRCRFEYAQAVGPWAVRFTVYENFHALTAVDLTPGEP